MGIFYNEKTKKFETQMGWLDLIDPSLGYRTLWQLARYVVDKVSSTGNISQDDSENIRTIIEEGRKQNVDEMEIEMNREVATGINIDGIEGVDVTFGSKGKTTYVMKIKYKHDD